MEEIGELRILGIRASYLVRWQRHKELDRLVEIVYQLLLGCITGVTAWIQGANARSMFSPFMLPEALVVALVVFPVCVHVRQ